MSEGGCYDSESFSFGKARRISRQKGHEVINVGEWAIPLDDGYPLSEVRFINMEDELDSQYTDSKGKYSSQ